MAAIDWVRLALENKALIVTFVGLLTSGGFNYCQRSDVLTKQEQLTATEDAARIYADLASKTTVETRPARIIQAGCNCNDAIRAHERSHH